MIRLHTSVTSVKMSIATVNEAHPEASLAMPPKEHSAKPSYKSNRQVIIRFVAYHLAADKSSRKKYLKSRHVFKAKMRDSNTLFEHEQRTTQIADRLQEQLEYFSPMVYSTQASSLLTSTSVVNSSTFYTSLMPPIASQHPSAITCLQHLHPPRSQVSNLMNPSNPTLHV